MKEGEEGVLQDFNFPQGAVTGVDFERVIGCQRGQVTCVSPLSQIQNVRLDRRKKGTFSRIKKFGHFRALYFTDHVKEFPAESAHGSKKAVTRFQMQLLREGIFPFPSCNMMVHFPVGDDVSPKFPAWVHKKKVDVYDG